MELSIEEISKDEWKRIKKHNYKIITPIVICNHYSHPIKAMTTASSIKAGKTIYTYR